jgi:hypothetical protein
MAGLAVGSKFSAVLLVLPLIAAAWMRARRDANDRPVRLILYVLVSFGAGALAFGLTNPFSLIELRPFVGNILAQNAMVSGGWTRLHAPVREMVLTSTSCRMSRWD